MKSGPFFCALIAHLEIMSESSNPLPFNGNHVIDPYIEVKMRPEQRMFYYIFFSLQVENIGDTQ